MEHNVTLRYSLLSRNKNFTWSNTETTALIDGYTSYFSYPRKHSGYSGRVITTYHLIKHEDKIQRLAIINIYCPRVDPDKPERFLYKMQFCFLLEAKLRELCKTGCSVIILGDLNIANSIIDHCDPGDENEFNSSKPRQWLKALLSSKFPFCDGNDQFALFRIRIRFVL
ncbi:DNA-(apurinic or apyrimidinic site) lyase [Trichonephila inaurata madagascariensis]|uniref:DNA-(Apurinic or apyrimidinic site) lyase n=1 Tax=Trichonephila inaurata madagascariensis TaxID=2747483 RepID=A0A8X7C5X3_9ARAC|nr:DNA-(apurinic or apyrimidinic site) lyase [Trichonephila inaurata madagascariensis]